MRESGVDHVPESDLTHRTRVAVFDQRAWLFWASVYTSNIQRNLGKDGNDGKEVSPRVP